VSAPYELLELTDPFLLVIGKIRIHVVVVADRIWGTDVSFDPGLGGRVADDTRIPYVAYAQRADIVKTVGIEARKPAAAP
jgi:hypothetical protein